MKLFFATVPLAALIGVEIYVAAFDGWGAWATAPLLVAPAIIGFAIGSATFIELCANWNVKQLRLKILGRLALTLIPLFWLLIRKQIV